MLDTLAVHDPLAWYNAPPAADTFSQQMGEQPGALRIGLMASAPPGIPTDEACVAAARAGASALEGLGHSVGEVEVPTISEEMIAPFITLTQGGLADYEGVDWSAVEPHVAHQRKLAGETSAYDYAQAARALELLSRREVARWGRDFDVLLTPTSAILPPPAGEVLKAQHAAPGEPLPAVVASVAFTAFGNVSGLPAISLPLHATESGVPVGAQLTGGPWQEAILLRLARQLEEALPWSARRPALAQAA